MKSFVIITYDITDDNVRTKLANKLKDFGKRVQYSVFEGDITEVEKANLKEMLSKVKLDEDDSIRLYSLCKACVKSVEIWGSGEVTKDPEVVIV